MYSDILSPAAIGTYNRKLMRMTNLYCAVYFNEVVDIISHVIKKKKYDDEGYFLLQRDYVVEQTGIDIATQIACDAMLAKLGVFEVHATDPNKIRVQLRSMAIQLADDDADVIKKVKASTKITKEEKAQGKRLGIITRLQDGLVEQDPDLLRAYKDWIAVVYDKGVVRQQQVDIFKQTIETYTADKAVKLELIKKATLLSYRDASWVINAYEKEHKVSASKLAPQKVVSAVSTTTTF